MNTNEQQAAPELTVFGKGFEHSEALYRAALDEFASKGYQQASINSILSEAGMSKGQFYYHFASKEALYFALIASVIERKRAFLTEIVQPDDFSRDLFTLFSRQLRYGLEFGRKFPEVNRFSDSFIQERGNPIYDKALTRFNFQNQDFLSKRIEQAYATGELRNDLPLSFIQTIIGYLFTHAVEAAGLHGVDSAEENLEYLISFLRTGLSSQKDPNK
jgi:AcrR family transcriptional regulator